MAGVAGVVGVVEAWCPGMTGMLPVCGCCFWSVGFLGADRRLARLGCADVALTRGGPTWRSGRAPVLAEPADRAGVFSSAAGVCAKGARGSTGRLFLLITALGIFTTIGVEPRHDGVCSPRWC